MKRTLVVTLFVLAVSCALAITYRVDPAGGPDSLAEQVAAAFGAWLELDDTLSAEVSEDAATRFAYASDTLLGPDTASLTLQRQNPAGVEVLVAPNANNLASALLHESGLLLGLGVRSEGVMNPALPETPISLSEEDTTALRQELGSSAEDLNFDGVVDFYDLVELAKGFGQTGVSLAADIDGSGVVDDADVEKLRAAYTFSAPSSISPAEAETVVTDEFGLESSPEDTTSTESSGPAQDPTDPTTPNGADGAEDAVPEDGGASGVPSGDGTSAPNNPEGDPPQTDPGSGEPEPTPPADGS